MNPILILTRLTLREATRRKIVLAAFIVGLGFLLVYSIGFHIITTQVSNIGPGRGANNLVRSEGMNFLSLAGLYAVAFLSIAMAALLSADALAGEISSGTVQSLVSKPVRRSDVVLGKWLGFAILLALYQLLMGGGAVLSVWLQSGYAPPHLLAGLGLIYLEALLVMSVALMFSSRLTALATGAVVFGLYGLAFIGGWVEQIGALLGNDGATNIGIVASLLVPSEALWNLAAYNMQPAIMRDLNITPFSPASVPSTAMVWWAVAYILVVLAFGLRQFETRDL